MADAGLFVGWGEVVRGRETEAVEVFNETLGYYARLQEEGTIESFEPVFLEPHGGDLNGFILIRGEAEKLAALRVSEEFTQFALACDAHRRGLRCRRRRHGASGSSARWSSYDRARSPHSPNNAQVQGRRASRRVRRPRRRAASSLAGCGNDVDVELVWGGPPDAGTGRRRLGRGLRGLPERGRRGLGALAGDGGRRCSSVSTSGRPSARRSTRRQARRAAGPDGRRHARRPRRRLGASRALDARLRGGGRRLHADGRASRGPLPRGRGHQDFAADVCV